jgi:hypothetical protein
MKKYIVTTIMMVFLAACEEEEVHIELREPVEPIPLWIDDSCPENIIEATSDATDALEDLFGQQMVNIIGFTNIESHESRHAGAGTHSLVCYSEEVSGSRNWAGYGWTDDSVDLYLFRYNPDGYRPLYRLILHELGHYIGLQGHPDDCDGGITSDGGFEWEFQQCDADFICEFFDCI